MLAGVWPTLWTLWRRAEGLAADALADLWRRAGDVLDALAVLKVSPPVSGRVAGDALADAGREALDAGDVLAGEALAGLAGADLDALAVPSVSSPVSGRSRP